MPNLEDELNEALGTSRSDTSPNEKFTPNIGRQTAMKAKQQIITRKDRLDLLKETDLEIIGQTVDNYLKGIMIAVDNTPLKQFTFGRLQQFKKQFDQKMESAKKRQQ